MSQSALQTSNSATEDRRIAAVVELSKLPLFPAAALQLLRIPIDSNECTSKYEQAFKSDVGLAAELLLVVNSAAFGGRSRIDSIRHAITFLGLERVKALADTIAFCFYVRKAPRIDYVRQIWSHAVATAIIAEKIGALHGRNNGYTSGLMHDLGRLVLLKVTGPEYATELSQQFTSIESSNEFELAHFGMDHCEAGDAIARQWGFPDNLRQCMSEHHAGCEGEAKSDVDDVRLACRMAAKLGYPEILVGEDSLTTELDLDSHLDAEVVRKEIVDRIAMLDA